MAFGLRAEVKHALALVVAVRRAVYHGKHITRVGVDAHHAGRNLVCVVAGQKLLNGVFCSVLVVGANRGIHRQAALEDGVLVKFLKQQALHVIGEVGVGPDIGLELARVEVERLLNGPVVFLLGNVAFLQHELEHVVAALDGCLGVDRGVVVRRRLWKAHEQRGLGQVQVNRVLIEIGDARGLDAIGARAIIDRIEIHEQYLVFGVHFLQLKGYVGFAHLTAQRTVELLVGKHGVAHELLGDRGAALAAAQKLRVNGAHDALGVDAVVLVEAAVFRVDRALDHVGADLVIRYRPAVLQVVLGQLVAFGVVDARGLGHEVSVGRAIVGQLLEP